MVEFYTSDDDTSVKEALFTTMDDNIPEIEETFIVVIESLSSDVSIQGPSTAQIVILPNDDANGVIQFEDVSLFVEKWIWVETSCCIKRCVCLMHKTFVNRFFT